MRIKRIIPVLIVVTLWVHGCIREDVLLPPVVEPLDDSVVISHEKYSLTGNYFDPASTRLFINDTIRDLVGELTLTELQFIVPDVIVKTKASLYVETNLGRSNTVEFSISPPEPKITKLIPLQAGIGKTIKIIGKFFGQGVSTTVLFRSAAQNNYREATISRAAKDTLEVIVPVGLDRDAANIYVKSEVGESDAFPFTVLAPPKILSIYPLKAGAGALVNLIGTDFSYIERVRFGDKPAEIFANTAETLEVRVPADATTDTVYVETGGGVGKSSNKFIIVSKPEITSLDKWSGSVGTEVNIAGLNFLDVFEVKFGSAPASILGYSGSTIKTRVPVGAVGGKISVTTPGGIGESSRDFIVQDAPLISSFAPSTGSPGTRITLTGFNLSEVTTAKIGIVPLSIDLSSTTDNNVEVEVPSGAVTGKISVTGPGGTYETTSLFTISGTPQILSVTPASGTPNTVVTITGVNFPVNLPLNPVVKFSGGAQAVVSTASSTTIVCQVPAAATTGKINVNGAVSPSDFVITVKPGITSIVPMKGGTDKEVIINGTYLTGATIRFFNNIVATKVGTDTDSKITVKVPAGASTGKISITTAGGTTYSAGDFELVSPPTISSFSPLSGIAGTIVTVNGTNLQHNPFVQFFNQATAVIKSVSPNQILVEVPPGAATGKLTIRTDAVNAPVSSASNFTVIGKPAITSISPGSGTIYEKLTIQGANLDGLVSVNFDGVSANTIISASNTQIVVRVPENVSATATRSINVNVKTNADVSGNSTFLLLGTPTITKVSPDNNPTNWAFLIEGTNLGSVKRVSLDGKVPDIGTNGIDKQAYNYITTKVPKDASPADDRILRLYYTSDDYKPLETSYKILSAPPPGIFPPATIILPPPIPSSYVQTDLSNYWIDENFQSPGPDSVLSCYQLRAKFAGQSSDDFCIVGKFYAMKVDGNWTYDNFSYGSGSWDNGYVSLSFPPQNYTGQVLDQAASRLVLTSDEGRQLILVGDKSNGCFKAYLVPGPCD